MVYAHGLCPLGAAAIQNDNNSAPPSLSPLLNVGTGQTLSVEFVAAYHRFLHGGRFTDVEKTVNRHIRQRGHSFPETQNAAKQLIVDILRYGHRNVHAPLFISSLRFDLTGILSL